MNQNKVELIGEKESKILAACYRLLIEKAKEAEAQKQKSSVDDLVDSQIETKVAAKVAG